MYPKGLRIRKKPAARYFALVYIAQFVSGSLPRGFKLNSRLGIGRRGISEQAVAVNLEGVRRSHPAPFALAVAHGMQEQDGPQHRVRDVPRVRFLDVGDRGFCHSMHVVLVLEVIGLNGLSKCDCLAHALTLALCEQIMEQSFYSLPHDPLRWRIPAAWKPTGMSF